jgi:hypothetical protein
MTGRLRPPKLLDTADIRRGLQEVVSVKVVLAALALVLAVPVALVAAVALGPVILVLLCAVGFGLIVFVVGNLAIGLGKFGRSVERAGLRHTRHGVS